MRKVLVLGSMNNLPTYYAADLSYLGCEVIQVVGFSKKYHLHDPMNLLSKHQLTKISILSIPFFHNFALPLIRAIYIFVLSRKLPAKWRPDIVIFNDTYVTLSKYFSGAKKIYVPHGGDIETWCGFNGATPAKLTKSMRKSGIFKIMPPPLRYLYIHMLMSRFSSGLALVDIVIFFPPKFTSVTARVHAYCTANNISYWDRYDINLDPLTAYNGALSAPRKKEAFKILVPVRFAYKTFPELNEDYHKGSDVILEGINLFLESNPGIGDVEVVCYEKGVDLEPAKELIDAMPALSSATTWKAPVPFMEFLADLTQADFCFDGVGRHWPGAIAAYCLVLGIPIGANFQKVRHLYPSDVPHLYQMSSPIEVSQKLCAAYRNRLKGQVDPKVLSELKRVYSTFNVSEKIFNIE